MKAFVIQLIVLIFFYLNFTSEICAQKNEYTILPDSSELIIKVYKTGIASIFGDNHIVYAGDFSGKLIIDSTALNPLSVSVEVKTKSLVTDDPKYRERFGLTSKISETDREEIKEHMLSSRQLDADKYPFIIFKSDSIIHKEDSNYLVTGYFTLHGMTKVINFPADIIFVNNFILAKGQFNFKQSDFGVEPYSTALGTVKNRDEVLLIFKIFAILKDE